MAPDIFLDTMGIVSKLILLPTIALFAVIAYGDIKSLRIPNWLCAAVAILGVLRLAMNGDSVAACATVAIAVAIFLVTLVLFHRGIMGGGDAKLLVATVLLVGYHDLLPFLAVMSIGGALLALVVLVRHAFEPTRPKAVPYGVAISSAAVVILLFQSSLIG